MSTRLDASDISQTRGSAPEAAAEEDPKLKVAREAFNTALCNALKDLLRRDPSLVFHATPANGMSFGEDSATGRLSLGANGELLMDVGGGRQIDAEADPTRYVLTQESQARYIDAIRGGFTRRLNT